MFTGAMIAKMLFLTLFWGFIGTFMYKKLNPRFEELIEKRINRVAYLAIIAILALLLNSIILDIWYPRARSTTAAPIVTAYLIYAPSLIVCGICSYFIARLKGEGCWQSVVLGIFGAIGFLFAILQCLSYKPIEEKPDYPIYRGKKIAIICESCGRRLHDYECNIGMEGVCPKCGNRQVIPTLKEAKEKRTQSR